VRGCSGRSNPFNQGIADPVEIREAELGDHGWVLERHAYLFEDQEAWGEPFIAMIARLIADYLDGLDPEREAAWIAELDGERVGSVYCTRRSEEVAQLRLMFVDRQARGHGAGSKLVEHCIAFARERGYERMMLSTVSPLASARRIYEAAGFVKTMEEPDPAFPEGTVAQEMWLDLKS
jgi:GNAT superfamily N-acetyltransferase